VLIAEDSATIRRHLTELINAMPGLTVIGEARDGQEALSLVPRLQPDIVSMDVRMPVLDGLEATRRLMAQHPTPVVIVSGLVETDIELSFNALEAGALAVVEKPPSRQDPAFEAKYRQLAKTLKAMSRVSVVRRGDTSKLRTLETVESSAISAPQRTPEVIVVGASAGGPSALNHLVSTLPKTLHVPIVIVQHMPHEFIVGLANWLEKSTPLGVKIAENNAVLEAGVVHLSPGKAHLRIERRRGELVTVLIKEQGDYKYFPSVDVLFESVAVTCGKSAIGIILTGMGDDGASGLLAMRQAGAHTIAQDEESSTVFGMPGAAIDRGAIDQVIPLANLSTVILNLV